jgi:hypothetical protein
MDVESRDGWTFLRLVSTNNTWQWTNRVASPSYTNTIRAVCSFSQKKKNWKFLSPFFGYFFVIYSPHRFKYEWGGGEFCDVCDGWVFLFYFLYFFVRENGRRVFRFSTVHRIHIPLDWESGRVGCMAWTAYPRRGCSTLCRLMFVKCGGTPLIFSFLFIRAAGWLPHCVRNGLWTRDMFVIVPLSLSLVLCI